MYLNKKEKVSLQSIETFIAVRLGDPQGAPSYSRVYIRNFVNPNTHRIVSCRLCIVV